MNIEINNNSSDIIVYRIYSTYICVLCHLHASCPFLDCQCVTTSIFSVLQLNTVNFYAKFQPVSLGSLGLVLFHCYYTLGWAEEPGSHFSSFMGMLYVKQSTVPIDTTNDVNVGFVVMIRVSVIDSTNDNEVFSTNQPNLWSIFCYVDSSVAAVFCVIFTQ